MHWKNSESSCQRKKLQKILEGFIYLQVFKEKYLESGRKTIIRNWILKNKQNTEYPKLSGGVNIPGYPILTLE